MKLYHLDINTADILRITHFSEALLYLDSFEATMKYKRYKNYRIKRHVTFTSIGYLNMDVSITILTVILKLNYTN